MKEMTIEEQKKKYDLIAQGLKVTGLGLVRSHMIVETLIRGKSERGNSAIIKRSATWAGEALEFFYRDTPILWYFLADQTAQDIKTDFDLTTSTKNQRELALKALSEVFGVNFNV